MARRRVSLWCLRWWAQPQPFRQLFRTRELAREWLRRNVVGRGFIDTIRVTLTYDDSKPAKKRKVKR